MPNIFLISDTHFNHKNFLTFKDKEGKIIRPFNNVDEMDETMIRNWNSVVAVQDKVYHLGDVFFGNQKRANEILSQLNGHKRLVIGNHDVIYGKNNPLHMWFEKMFLWRPWPTENLLLTHVPVHPNNIVERFGNKCVNLHGHIHDNDSPEGLYINMCVERHNYTPVPIDTAIEWAKQKLS